MASIEISESEKGFVIGKGGSNIKRVQAESGARVVVEGAYVRISGAPSAVDRAKLIIKSQLATHRAHTMSFEHPTVVIQLVDPRMLDNAVRCVPAPVQKEATTTYRLTLPTSTPAAATAAQASSNSNAGNDADALADAFGATRLELDQKRAFYAWNDRRTMQLVLTSAVGTVAAATSSTTAAGNTTSRTAGTAMRTKVRFNVGRQLFYAHKGQAMPVLSRGLATTQIGFEGGAMKAVFSNHLSAADAAAISTRLGTLGFKVVERRETVSCHLEDKLTRRALAVRFVVPGASPASSTASAPSTLDVAKTKTANRRHCFVSVCNTDPLGLDARFKFLSNGPLEATEDAMVRSEIDGARWSAGALRLPALRSFLCDKARRKSKIIYEGDYAGSTFRVSVVIVEDESGKHHEVAGTSAAWNLNLSDIKAYEATVQFTQALAGWSNANPATAPKKA